MALALSASVSAQAASMVDRGLEQRVSDLEAEVRLLKNRVKALEDRKLDVPDKIVVSGNSRVKVTLYGQVNRAVRFHFAENDASINHVDNDASSSRIGILARGRLFPDLTISARTEVEWQENRRSFTNDSNLGNERVRARHVDLWFTHADLGSLWIGHGSTAADAASLFTLTGTSIVWASHGADDGVVLNNCGPCTGQVTGTAIFPGLYYAPTTGLRQNRVMYTSPRIAGFEFRASHSELDRLEAAVRYAGSPFGLQDIRVLGAFGFIYNPDGGTSVPTTTAGSNNTYAGSIAMLHVPSGLNAAFMAGTTVQHGTNYPGQNNQKFWYVEGGWQGRIWAMGKTYWSVGGGMWDGGIAVPGTVIGAAPAGINPPTPAIPACTPATGAPGGLAPATDPNCANDVHAWRINTAIVQEIDSAATDVYLGYAYYDAKVRGTSLNAAHIIIMGARIKF